MFSRFKVDTGTKLLLRNLDFNKDDRMLDMCCGYGIIGIISAKFCSHVVMSDINERGLEMVKRNLNINNINQSSVTLVSGDLFENVDVNEKFTIIATNPPLRAGMDFMIRLLEGAKEHLAENGRIFLVARKKQGAYEILDKMNELFNAEIVETGGGYRVMKGVKA
jgi:16S rRNA (guanine1207-N2)-methyltransferase